VLVEPVLDADVLTHAAWHHAARRALADGATPSAAALFLGEAVASAFDAYLVGQLLRQGKQTDFLKTQLPAMTEARLGAGLEEEAVQALFARMAEDPDAAFEALRGLLFEVSLALYRAPDLDAAAAVLAAAAEHPFAGLLHHYALSAWVLYARAYAGPAGGPGGPRPPGPGLAARWWVSVGHVRPRPASRHALAAAALGMDLGSPFQRSRGGPGGWWILSEPELHLGGDVLVPEGSRDWA
jgi:hypothetical protein